MHKNKKDIDGKKEELSFKECVKIIVICLSAVGGFSFLAGIVLKLLFKIALFKGVCIGLILFLAIILLTKAWQPANISEAIDEEDDD